MSQYSVKSLLYPFILISSPNLFAAEAAKKEVKTGFFAESVSYKDIIYSGSEKAESGARADVSASFRYQYSENTFARFRTQVRDEIGYEPDKTSEFELGLFHKEGRISGAIDADLLTNDDGGISMGFDQDSERTWVAFDIVEGLNLQYLPFNIGTKVGQKFWTHEVSQVHYVSSPLTVLSNVPVNNEKVVSKTTPGIMFNWNPDEYVSVSLGGGVVSYLYPTGENVTLEEGLITDSWHRRQATSIVFRGTYDDKEKFSFNVEHASQNSAEKTGSMLTAATSVRSSFKESIVRVSGEFTGTKAGRNPYNLKDGWFANNNTTLFNPTYVDIFNQKQNWIGQQGLASLVKFELVFDKVMPFIQAKNYSEHFIANQRESAHRLRTADLTKSHGGLRTYGLGTTFASGQYEVTPEVEFQKAKNAVFLDASKIRSDDRLSGYKKDNIVGSITLNYNFQ